MGDNRADINDVLGRFLKFVLFTDDCWLWTGYLDKKSGYGQLRIPADNERGSRVEWVHRVAYNLFKGPIPKGMEPDHLCRVRNCIHPDHLEAVTHRENVLRGIGPSAQQARQTHCRRGHAFVGDNLIIDSRSKRVCRICRDSKNKERYHARNRADN